MSLLDTALAVAHEQLPEGSEVYVDSVELDGDTLTVALTARLPIEPTVVVEIALVPCL